MSSSDSESDEDYYGPALPPGFKQTPAPAAASSNDPPGSKSKPSESGGTIGPVIPPELRAKLEKVVGENEAGGSGHTTEDNQGEGKLSHEEESDSDSDSEVIGPLPPDHPKAQRRAAGSSFLGGSESKKPKREEWMLVPPKNRIIPGLGLGPRKFLTRAPEDSKQSDEEEDEEAMFAREADAEIQKKLIDDYDQKMDSMKKDFETKKKRGQSLLEIHQTEMKKKSEKTEVKAERKPFDRDNDLKISGMSSDDKQKYIEKSKELNTKFSRGSRKYL